MKTYTPSRAPCPIARAARVLGDRWVLLILRDAFLGAERFEEFVERLGINRAALTSRLAILQEVGLLRREPPEGKRARYILTDSARALVPVFEQMAGWSSAHLFAEGERVWLGEQASHRGDGLWVYSKDATTRLPINTGAVANAALRATASVNVTDNTGNGATLTGGGAGGTYFNAAYNNGTTFADLVAGPLVAPATGSDDSSQDFPAAPGVFLPIGVPLNNLQAQFNFTLSAGDSAGGTSGFFSIPSPASGSLLALAGIAAVRRRR
ncbi:MAG: helix-turn-helix transcriptional regulator [Sphingomonadales bacterium]|nr:helix-turn-helix transcriptional regulator [Sphingomonadales bacterium]